ncbi:MAG: acylneuraminate cytidylyltransferase family protein [Methanoregulaceae archaeon]|jgi:N-acylneuraminate cytidylyltransferase|nr:acylneuraminate cytidylyltransferase family protein [Methanoregulaceae archaeon]
MILGITPARGGSKGLPQKNIKPICGKPLIAWTIEAALQSTLLDRYVVSTEDPEIKTVSRTWGAEVVDRPQSLATDDATTLSVLQDVLKKIDADIVVILQCTSPVRSRDLIDRCIDKFLTTGADALATGYMCNLFEWGSYSSRRQDLKSFFHDDGNVFVIRAENIRNGDMFAGKREILLIGPEYRFEIDDEFDFWLNEQILLKRKNTGSFPA